MSLLVQGSSSKNILPYGNNLDRSCLYGLTDGFADDADDDDLSLDGIDDEDEDEHSTNKKAPQVASRNSYFAQRPPERDIQNFLSRSQADTPFLNTSLPLPRGPPAPSAPARTYYPGVDICIVCQSRPPCSKNGKSYPTCGLTCARVLDHAVNGNKPPPGTGCKPPRQPHANTRHINGKIPQRQGFTPLGPNIDLPSFLAGLSVATGSPQFLGNHTPSPRRPHNNRFPTGGPTPPSTVATGDPCVMCQRPLAAYSKSVTCGLTCTEKLHAGGGNPTMCNYCHRRPKLGSHNQCGQTCAQAAKVACLYCKSRPKFKRYNLCGKTCKQLSTKKTPLLLEVPMEHATWDMVKQKFDNAWKITGTKPTITKIYKIIEDKNFLLPYDKYKKKIGRNTEVFRYHGTSRRCTLGTNGNTMLCNDSGCPLCCILKTSFKTSLANPNGAFGPGIYSSSAANKAYGFARNGQGGLILTKVILGKVHDVGVSGGVKACPAGHDSVVYDQNGPSNETIVYSDDAIRPVFLLVFT